MNLRFARLKELIQTTRSSSLRVGRLSTNMVAENNQSISRIGSQGVDQTHNDFQVTRNLTLAVVCV